MRPAIDATETIGGALRIHRAGRLSDGLLKDGRRRQRAKPKPKYRSKKKRSLKWSGRGLMPAWMREEMKGTKLKKDDFLLS
ncbi:MAG: H-NS histone family protein [Alphaproteobacteria bacterium]|nr:H-NS histone family protein [Alphaproteobacteria bacterium]